MPKLKAILIDLDGTLRDSRDVIYPALQHALKVHTGKRLTREEIAPHVHHLTEVSKQLAPDTDFETFDATYSSKIEELRSKIVLYADAAAILETLVTAGYVLATVTSARNARRDLITLEISEYFEVTVGGNDVKEHKPHPEPVLEALKQLKVKASDSVMVGDLIVDIQAARAAGVAWTIGITHGFGAREQLQAAGADYIIDSLAELPGVIKAIEQK